MGRLLDGLIAWSIHQRAVVLLGALALAVGGIWSASHASLDVLPDFTPPRVVVQTEAPGMSTTDVEQLVTLPLERALLGTPQATSVRSLSMPGLSVVTMMFEEGLDIYRARQLVTERAQLARTHLPKAAKEPQLAPIAAPIGALLRFCITAGDGQATLRELRTFAEWTLSPRLLAIPGVAQVTVQGGDVERIEVRPSPVRMRQRGVTLAALTTAIQASQSIIGAGFVDQGPARIDVVNDSRLTIADAVAQLGQVVIMMRGRLPVRIADVAEVVHANEPPFGAAIYDGRPAVYVQITKLPWADTLRTTTEVERALDELKRSLPPEARMEAPVFRQASFVRTSVWSVARAMLIGSLLVIVILIAFLRRGRLAVISIAAIPLSILAALAVLVSAGASINGMTLGGLAIAVGELVDDAIVDVENVWRRLRENAKRDEPRPALDVIHDASKEVRGSVVYATIIVCLVLVPVLTLGGVAGRIFSPLAQAYILAILASLVVALTVTPAMCAWLLPRAATSETKLPRLSEWLLARYGAILRRVVHHPRLVLTLAGLAGVAAIAVVPFLGGRFLPEFHERSVIAHVNAVPGTSLDETVRLARRTDAELRPAVGEHLAARAGRAELGEDAVPVNRIELDLLLKAGESREWDQIVIDVATRIGRVPGLGFVVEGFLGERVHEILAGVTSPVVVTVLGPDLQQLRALAAEAARIMGEVPGLGSIAVEPQIDVPQLSISPDRASLARFGVTPAELGDDLVAWRQGRPLTQILGRTGRVVDVVVAGPPEMRTGEALADIPVDTPASGALSLSALARVDLVPAPATIGHEGGVRRITIGADSRGGGLSRAASTLSARLQREVHPPEGYQIVVGGEAVARSQAAMRLLLVGLLVLLGIFVLLATAFDSLGDAGIVLLNFPLGLVGGVLAALLNPEGLSVAGLVGFVTLFGIISRNGIMLVTHKQLLDKQDPDQDPVARILRAAEERLLPILMTATTAGLGLLPLALSMEAAGSELEAPMAVIVCGGLITSTILNMLVLPTLYVWLAERRKRKEAA